MACSSCRRAPWQRLESYKPAWPLPKIFRLTSGGKLIEGIFKGETINTPSMLCVEDYIDALEWAKRIGGLDALVARADANAGVIADWVAANPSGRLPGIGTGHALQHLGLPALRRPGGGGSRRCRPAGFRKGADRPARDGEGGLRHRQLPRCTAGPADLVRRNRRDIRSSRAVPWLDWAFATTKAGLKAAA